MHRTWIFEVKDFLREGNNSLTVLFKSAVAHDLQAEKDASIPLPYNYSYSRKASYQYGWDWGPRIVSAGIWKALSLRHYDTLRIKDALFRNQKVNGNSTGGVATIYGSVNLEGKTNGN